MVQWLGFRASTAKGGSTPGWELRSQKLLCAAKKKEEGSMNNKNTESSYQLSGGIYITGWYPLKTNQSRHGTVKV